VLVLHYKPENNPVVVPDYYGMERNDWIVYPWEIDEL